MERKEAKGLAEALRYDAWLFVAENKNQDQMTRRQEQSHEWCGDINVLIVE